MLWNGGGWRPLQNPKHGLQNSDAATKSQTQVEGQYKIPKLVPFGVGPKAFLTHVWDFVEASSIPAPKHSNAVNTIHWYSKPFKVKRNFPWKGSLRQKKEDNNNDWCKSRDKTCLQEYTCLQNMLGQHSFVWIWMNGLDVFWACLFLVFEGSLQHPKQGSLENDPSTKLRFSTKSQTGVP